MNKNTSLSSQYYAQFMSSCIHESVVDMIRDIQSFRTIGSRRRINSLEIMIIDMTWVEIFRGCIGFPNEILQEFDLIMMDEDVVVGDIHALSAGYPHMILGVVGDWEVAHMRIAYSWWANVPIV